MRLSENRAAKLPVSLTPLIDVVFLLLIFFMLVSTFLKFNTMPITAVTSGPGVTEKKEIVLIQILGAQQIKVNGASVPFGGLLAHIDRLVAKGATNAIVKPMSDVTVQDLVSVLDRARHSTLKSVLIVR